MDSIRKITGMAALVCMVAAISGAAEVSSGACLNPGHEPGTMQVWRDLEHGGFNALYFLLKVCGDSRTYEECLARMRGGQLPQTLAEVLAAAERLEYPLRARSLSPEQLDRLRLPVIVHVEGDNLAEGCFFVLLQNQGQRLAYLDGPSGTICTMDKESFLRRWSGVAVSPSSHSYWIGAGQAIFGVICGLSLARFRYRR